MHGQRCFAEPARAVDRSDRDIASRCAQHLQEVLRLCTATSIVRDIRRKLTPRRGMALFIARRPTATVFRQEVEDRRVGDLCGELIDADKAALRFRIADRA
jgi:hypothetical protein